MTTIRSHLTSFVCHLTFFAGAAATSFAMTLLLPLTAEAAVLDEITVMATRRAETDIQTTPISVTPVNEVQIDRLVGRDLLSLAIEAPNVVAGKQPGFNSANWAIRGVGQASIILYFESQVGTTVDDFVIPHIQTANIEMLDLDTVEILRGPQGTLFGKNTTGGVINVRTKPADLEEGSFEVRGKVAEFGRTEGQAILNIPFAENWAFRAAGMYMKSDGYFENGAAYGPVTIPPFPGFPTDYPLEGATGQGDGSDVGGDDLFSGRFKLRWQPTEDLNLNLTYEIVRDQGDTPVSVNGTPNNEPGYLWNLLGFSADLSGDQTKQGAVTNREDVLMQMGSRGHETDVDGVYFNADWSFSDNYTLTGMVGYRETSSWLPSTYTGEVGPVSLFDANRQDERETTQLEVRLASDLDGPFNWLAGAFYQKDDTLFTVAQALGFVDMTIDSAAFFGDPLFFNNNPQVLSNGQDSESYAFFADGTWDVTEKWTLSAGARWTHEEKDWTGRNQRFTQALQSSSDPGGCDPAFFGGPTWQELGEPLAAADFSTWDCGVIRDSEEWDEPTWRFAASYQVTDDLFTYFNYARGFKSGGYNDQAGTSGSLEPIQARPTDPETADSFELGLRSDPLENLRLNLTAFYVVYDDSIQPLVAAVSRPPEEGGDFEATRFFNAAEITVWGIEFEPTWLVTEQFTLRGNLGYLDAEFDKFEADTNLDGMIDTDLSGNPVARTPELTWSLFALYEHDLLGGRVDWSADLSYEDSAVYAYTAVPDTPNGMTDDRTLLNASVTYTSRNDLWWVRAYGKNLTDEEYRIGELPVGGLWVMTYWGEPRVLGVEAGMKFGW
ncbi:MAG: TonB-dependent receptor [Gammaproteobacteria bacterium]|nr:TonB-dependent receptor [Gammaproteobacteria bacterium]